MICLHDRKGKQCGTNAHFDVFKLTGDGKKWASRACRLHLASFIWDLNDMVLVVPRHQPPAVIVPSGMTPTKRLRRTLRRRAARSAP